MILTIKHWAWHNAIRWLSYFTKRQMQRDCAALLFSWLLVGGQAVVANEADNSGNNIDSGLEVGDSQDSLAGNVPVAVIRHNPFTLPEAIKVQRNPPAKKSLIDLSGGLKLRAILFSQTNPLVNLNGKILAVGEEIQGYRLARVYKTHVELVKNTKTYELKLIEESAPSHG